MADFHSIRSRAGNVVDDASEETARGILRMLTTNAKVNEAIGWGHRLPYDVCSELRAIRERLHPTPESDMAKTSAAGTPRTNGAPTEQQRKEYKATIGKVKSIARRIRTAPRQLDAKTREAVLVALHEVEQKITAWNGSRIHWDPTKKPKKVAR